MMLPAGRGAAHAHRLPRLAGMNSARVAIAINSLYSTDATLGVV
jgi:hypothetical protein